MNTRELAAMTEKEFTGQFVELARTLGWKRYHTYRSDKSPGGWPDEALVRERLILFELKTETGKPSPLQRDWLLTLHRAGVETYLVRPHDLDDVAQILSVRHRFDDFPGDARGDQARVARARLRAAFRRELG